MDETKVLLRAEGLTKDFHVPGGVVSSVAGVDLEIYRGETLALVGESGCGKSTLGRLLLRLIEPTSGKVIFNGTDLTDLSARELRPIRQRMQIIFQDPFSSLDPRMKVGKIIEEPMKLHGLYPNRKEREEKVRELMARIGIRPAYYDRYPHQFSGGQRQRVGIARALALQPELVVCDEPVSALDVSIQAQILNLLKDLQQEFHLTYLFISHDLSVVRYISDRVCVMFLGRLCELGEAEEVYSHPRHPYTKFLMESVPLPDPDQRKEDRDLLTGEVPSPIAPPSGCRFHTRCPYAQPICAQEQPAFRDLGGGHCCACHFPLEG
jgi:oligopeptide transport system ATP-binding protein